MKSPYTFITQHIYAKPPHKLYKPKIFECHQRKFDLRVSAGRALETTHNKYLVGVLICSLCSSRTS